MTSRSSQCCRTGATKAVVCIILSVRLTYKRFLAANRKIGHEVAAMGFISLSVVINHKSDAI